MSFDSSIIAHFGGDTTGLQASTEEASIMMKGFSTSAGRAVSEIGKGFVGAVVFQEAIKGIREMASAAIDAAEQEQASSQLTGQAISEQSQAWLDLKAGIGDTKSGVLSFGIAVLSIFPELGDDIGGFINDMRGISPEAQKQYGEMAQTAEANIAKIKAAQAKLMEELPAKQAAANAKLAALDAQYASSQETSQDKVNALTADQDATLMDIAATQDEIDTQAAAGRDTQAAELKLTQLKAQLMQDVLGIQAAQVQGATDEVTANTNAFDVKKDSMTIEEQIVALKAQELTYEQEATVAVNNSKEAQLLKNAAAKDAVAIANDERTIRQATALSEQDQLAMFIAQTPALANLNTLSAAGLQLLQQQSAEKQTQYQIDQLLKNGADSLNAAEKEKLATLIQQSATQQQQIGLTQQAVTAENTLKTSVDAVAAATKGVVAATQEEVDDADKDAKFSGGIQAYQTIVTGAGVGSGDQQLLDAQSVANAKSSLESLQANLAKEINGYQNSDDPTEEALIPALQAKINALHQQEINISPTNLNGLAPKPFTPPTSGDQAQQQIQLLQGIHDAVVPAFKGG